MPSVSRLARIPGAEDLPVVRHELSGTVAVASHQRGSGLGRWWQFRVSLILLGILSVHPTLALAQVLPGWDFSVSAFGGGALPFDTYITIDSAGRQDVSEKNSAAFGGKIQAWTTLARAKTGLDFGAEVDVTQLYPDIKGRPPAGSVGPGPGAGRLGTGEGEMEISSTIVAVNLLRRRPFGASEIFPNGRWQPYIGIGGGAEVTHAERRLDGIKDTDIAPALQVLSGVKVFLWRNIALFAEYKFTRAAHFFEFNTRPLPRTEEITFSVNHVVGGIAFHF